MDGQRLHCFATEDEGEHDFDGDVPRVGDSVELTWNEGHTTYSRRYLVAEVCWSYCGDMEDDRPRAMVHLSPSHGRRILSHQE